MARCTRSRVASLTPAVPFSTAETVAFETPACRATSVMVGRLAVMGRSWRGALRNAEGARGAFCRTESNSSMLFDYVRRQTIRRRLQAVKKPLERPLPLLDKEIGRASCRERV